jgi:hypothetical protein
MTFMIIMVVTWIIKCSDCIVVLQDDINFTNVKPDAESEECESSYPEMEHFDIKDSSLLTVPILMSENEVSCVSLY